MSFIFELICVSWVENYRSQKIEVWLVNSILIGKLTGMHVYAQWLFLATSFSCVVLGSWCIHVFTVQNAITEESLKWVSLACNG